MEFTASKCRPGSNDQLSVEKRMSQQFKQGLLPSHMNDKVSLPPNAIISLPPSLSNTNILHSETFNQFVTSGPTQSSHPSILFTNKPVIILQEDASLFSRVLGGREHLTSSLLQQHSNTSCCYNPRAVCLDRQLPSLSFQISHSNNSLPEITEIVEEETKLASDSEHIPQQTVVTKLHETKSSDLQTCNTTSSLPASPSLSNNRCDVAQKSNSDQLKFLNKETASYITSKLTLEAVEYFSQRPKTMYSCEEQEKEILLQESDSELDLSELLEENQQQIKLAPLDNADGLQNHLEQNTISEQSPPPISPATEEKKAATQVLESDKLTSCQSFCPELPNDNQQLRDDRSFNDTTQSTKNESPDTIIEEPPLKRQRLSNESVDGLATEHESQIDPINTMNPTVPILKTQGDCEVNKQTTSPLTQEHDSQSSSVNHQSVLLEYPHEPTDIADDGRDTADQMLPTESAREHAFLPKLVHCRPDHGGPHSNNDRDDPTDGVSLNKSDDQDETVFEDNAQVPSLQQEEESCPNMTDLKVLGHFKHTPRTCAPVLAPQEETTQISKYTKSEDFQIVPGDSLDNSFTTEPLYSDTDKTKIKHIPHTSHYNEIDIKNTTETVGTTALNHCTSPQVEAEQSYCSKSLEATLPCHLFGWKTDSMYGSSCHGNRNMVQTQSSETFPVTRLNLTKPYLRLGLSRKQKCKPLHMRK